MITSASLDRHTQRSAAEIPTQIFTWQLPSPAFPAQDCTLQLCITPQRNAAAGEASGPRPPEELGAEMPPRGSGRALEPGQAGGLWSAGKTGRKRDGV